MKLRFKNSESKAFLKMLSPKDNVHVFQTFTDDKDKREHPDKLAKIFIGTHKQYRKKLRSLNRQGAGIFVTVQQTDKRGRKKKNITGIRAVFIEDDHGTNKKLPIEPNMVIETSPGKYHYYFITQQTDVSKFGPVQQTLVNEYGSDPNAKDLSRVLRVPGYYHMKGKPHLVKKIRSHTKPSKYSWKRIKKAFPPTPLKQKKIKTKPSSKSRSKKVSGKEMHNIAEVYSALHSISPDIEYDKWLRVGQALHDHSHGHREALQMWDKW